MPSVLERLTADDFSPLVGESFELPSPLPPLELVSVTPARHRAAPPARAGFSLIFRGPSTAPLGQGLVALSHPRLGAAEIFIVPIGAGDGTRDYEAVFN